MAKTRKTTTTPRTKSLIGQGVLGSKEEANIIGAMMTDKVFMFWCFKYRVTENDFKNEDAKTMFHLIETLKNQGGLVDLHTVTEFINEHGIGERFTPLILANIAKNADLKTAYASVKKRIKGRELSDMVYNVMEQIERRRKDEYKTVINFNENEEFRRFAERFVMWTEDKEIRSSLARLASPDTSVYDRQFYAGVLFAVKRFEHIFDMEEDEEGNLIGIKLSDVVNQYENWKKDFREEEPALVFRSKIQDEWPENMMRFSNEVPF